MRDLEYELVRFPKGQHEDILDSLSFGVRFWKPSVVEVVEEKSEGGTLDWFREQAKNISENKYYGHKQLEKVGFYAK